MNYISTQLLSPRGPQAPGVDSPLAFVSVGIYGRSGDLLPLPKCRFRKISEGWVDTQQVQLCIFLCQYASGFDENGTVGKLSFSAFKGHKKKHI